MDTKIEKDTKIKKETQIKKEAKHQRDKNQEEDKNLEWDHFFLLISKKLNVAKTEMSLKLKCHQNFNVTKI